MLLWHLQGLEVADAQLLFVKSVLAMHRAMCKLFAFEIGYLCANGAAWECVCVWCVCLWMCTIAEVAGGFCESVTVREMVVSLCGWVFLLW